MTLSRHCEPVSGARYQTFQDIDFNSGSMATVVFKQTSQAPEAAPA